MCTEYQFGVLHISKLTCHIFKLIREKVISVKGKQVGTNDGFNLGNSLFFSAQNVVAVTSNALLIIKSESH